MTSYPELYSQTARRVAVVGALTTLLSLGAGWLAGGDALRGALWGGGAGALMSMTTVIALAVPWQRYPMLAGGGVALSFLGKILIMVGTVILAAPHKQELDPWWFLGSLAVIVMSTTATEIVTLMAGRTSWVEPESQPEN